MEIKPEEYKLLHTFALWAYAKAFEGGNEFVKAAYAAACDLAKDVGIDVSIDELAKCADLGRVTAKGIAREFFDAADMLSPKLKAKVYAFDAIAKYVTPTLLETVDGRNLISVQGLYVPVNKLEFKAIAAAKGGARL